MSLTDDELRREHKAKLFNSYFGNLASLLVPLAVLGLTLVVGDMQKKRDAISREAEVQAAERRERESTRRECLAQMRETARMFATEPQGTSYSQMVASVASTLNDICGPAGVSLPTPLLQSVRDVQTNPDASPAVRATAARVIASQPLRLFMHIADEGQRAWARERERRIEQTLVGEAPVVVPGIELVSQAPRASELRYANAGDESEARALAQALEPILGGELSVRKIAAANVSPRTFELWISKSAASGA